jgi:hypothetical protein
MWLAIGFVPTYGAMELAWRIAKRRLKDKRRTTGTITIPEIGTASTMTPSAERK